MISIENNIELLNFIQKLNIHLNEDRKINSSFIMHKTYLTIVIILDLLYNVRVIPSLDRFFRSLKLFRFRLKSIKVLFFLYVHTDMLILITRIVSLK
jgi:hypothetical protein